MTRCERQPTMSRNDYRRPFNKWHTTDDGVTLDPRSGGDLRATSGGLTARRPYNEEAVTLHTPGQKKKKKKSFLRTRRSGSSVKEYQQRRFRAANPRRASWSLQNGCPSLPASLRWLLLLLLEARYSEDAFWETLKVPACLFRPCIVCV